MSFKFSGKIWELYLKKSIEDSQSLNIFWIISPDAFQERLVHHWLRSLFSEKIIYLAKDLSFNQLDEIFCAQDLFGPRGETILYHMENLPKNLEDKFIELCELEKGRKVFGLFQRETPFAKKLCKTFPDWQIKITAPAPWEGESYLRFLAAQMRLKIHPQGLRYLSEHLNLDSGLYVSSLNLLRHLFQEEQGEVSLENIKSVINEGRLDFFRAVENFSFKRFKSFEEEVSPLLDHLSQEEMIGLLSGLGRHMQKLLAPDRESKKRWDQKAQEAAKLWKEEEISQVMLEIDQHLYALKTGSPFYKEGLRIWLSSIC